MSEFIIKTTATWKSCTEELPPVGQSVEILATMITKASLVGTEPKQLWNQDEDMSEAQTEVKLWREIDEPKAIL